MKPIKYLSIIAALLLLSAQASVINIPDDYATIKEGIDSDANGDCQLIGSDVTFMVNYFRGQQPEIHWCPYTPPME